MHEEEEHHSSKVVGQDQRLLQKPPATEGLVEPPLFLVATEDPLAQQNQTERDGQDQDRGDGPLHPDPPPRVIGEEQADRHDHDGVR